MRIYKVGLTQSRSLLAQAELMSNVPKCHATPHGAECNTSRAIVKSKGMLKVSRAAKTSRAESQWKAMSTVTRASCGKACANTADKSGR